MGLGGRVIEYHGDLEDKGVREKVTGNNPVVCSRDTDIKIL